MEWASRSHKRQMRFQKRQVMNSNWHRWFAWHPVMIAIEGKTDYWAWLEYIDRKWKTGAYTGERQWRYRRAGSQSSVDNLRAKRLPAQPANTNHPPTPAKLKILADIAARDKPLS